MDKIRQQKLKEFIIKTDAAIRDIKNYLMLEKGDVVIGEIKKFEEENGEFLQYYPEGQEALNRRKYIIDFLLFPIISDDKVSELLQYHLINAMESGLDVEELMKQRAISTSELVWPKLSQEYLKALSQNTELIGATPISIKGDKSSYLPYVKNWISAYNQRFGIEKHSGLEPHQFVLEENNAKRLNKGQKEILLKVLKFYENLKVYSLSEIEKEVRKINEMLKPEAKAIDKQRGVILQQREEAKKASSAPAPAEKIKPTPVSIPYVSHVSHEENSAVEEETGEGKIKIMGQSFSSDQTGKAKSISISKESDQATAPPVENRILERGHVMELINKFSGLGDSKITVSSIRLVGAPFSASPTLNNWIGFYYKECGKGGHTPQERENFIERLKTSQSLSPDEIQNLSLVFRSLDEKNILPYDTASGRIAFDQISIGAKLKSSN